MNKNIGSSQRVGKPSAELKKELVRSIMNFIYQKLPSWRDDIQRTHQDAEKRLNAQLCTYLSVQSRNEELPYIFDLDEFQTGERQIDIAVKPMNALFFAYGYSSIYQAITVIEAKRLPAPSKTREKEYIEGEKLSGGIQRYKLMLHGAKHSCAGMIGYVQKDSLQFYHKLINKWIDELSTMKSDNWSSDEKLHPLVVDSGLGRSRTESSHIRMDGSIICLYHLWIEMNFKKGETFSKKTVAD
ncbi:MAG: hypothetical protein AB7D37_18025 [Desulfovibrio sp.]